MSAEVVAIIGAAVGLLAVLVPIMLYLHGRLAAEIADVRRDLRTDLAEIRADGRALTARVDALTERVARIEGAMNGPWRPPANGSPAPAPTTTTSNSVSAIAVSTASKTPARRAPATPPVPGRSYWAETGSGSGRLLTTPS